MAPVQQHPQPIHESGGPQIQVEIQSAVEESDSPKVAARALTSLTERNEMKNSQLAPVAEASEPRSMAGKQAPQPSQLSKKEKEKKKRKKIQRKVRSQAMILQRDKLVDDLEDEDNDEVTSGRPSVINEEGKQPMFGDN